MFKAVNSCVCKETRLLVRLGAYSLAVFFPITLNRKHLPIPIFCTKAIEYGHNLTPQNNERHREDETQNTNDHTTQKSNQSSRP